MPSSASSCSPSEARQYNLRSKRAKRTPKETSAGQANRGKPPPFLEELHVPFGRTTQDRRTLLTAGGVRQATLADMSQDPIGGKRPTREEVVDSAPKKKSLEDLVRDISESIVMRSQRRLSREQEEMDLVMQILEEDGIDEGTDLYCKAIYLCKNSVNRTVFTRMKTRAVRLRWILFNWDNR